MAGSRYYLPAAGRDWLLPLYDPFQRLLGGEAARRELLAQANLQPGQHVLDLGTGTGELALLVERLHPQAQVVGVDPDPRALARARRKAARVGAAIRFDEGFGDALPYPDACFDHVVSSFVLHHLDPETKRGALAEVHRVLRRGGSLAVLDFGGTAERPEGLLARLLPHSEHLHGQHGDRLGALMREARFRDVRAVAGRGTWLGSVVCYTAVAAPAGD